MKEKQFIKMNENEADFNNEILTIMFSNNFIVDCSLDDYIQNFKINSTIVNSFQESILSENQTFSNENSSNVSTENSFVNEQDSTIALNNESFQKSIFISNFNNNYNNNSNLNFKNNSNNYFFNEKNKNENNSFGKSVFNHHKSAELSQYEIKDSMENWKTWDPNNSRSAASTRKTIQDQTKILIGDFAI